MAVYIKSFCLYWIAKVLPLDELSYNKKISDLLVYSNQAYKVHEVKEYPHRFLTAYLGTGYCFSVSNALFVKEKQLKIKCTILLLVEIFWETCNVFLAQVAKWQWCRRDVTNRAIIKVNSTVSEQKHDILTMYISIAEVTAIRWLELPSSSQAL